MSVAIVCMINNTRLEEINYLTNSKDLVSDQTKNETVINDRKCAFTKLEKHAQKVEN
jgi:hypothetical protein